jgi:hypothetical protein
LAAGARRKTQSADIGSVDTELIRSRFLRLTTDLIRGHVVRNTFCAWEVALLFDVGSCAIDPKRRVDTLKKYQRAVEKQLDRGPGPPMLLSEFLQQRTTRRP